MSIAILKDCEHQTVWKDMVILPAPSGSQEEQVSLAQTFLCGLLSKSDLIH